MTNMAPEAWLVIGAEARRPFADEAEARAYAGDWGIVKPLYLAASSPVKEEQPKKPRCPRCGSGNPDTYLALANGEVCLHTFHEPALRKLDASRAEVPEPSPSGEAVAWRARDEDGEWIATCSIHRRDAWRKLSSFPVEPLYTHPAPPSGVVEALKPLVEIADAYDANALDDEARKYFGSHTNIVPPEQIELYAGRGGKRLLTLADCFAARAALSGKGPAPSVGDELMKALDTLRAIAFMDCYTREGEEPPHILMMRLAKECLSALTAVLEQSS
jgi:hypothetical protein